MFPPPFVSLSLSLWLLTLFRHASNKTKYFPLILKGWQAGAAMSMMDGPLSERGNARQVYFTLADTQAPPRIHVRTVQ